MIIKVPSNQNYCMICIAYVYIYSTKYLIMYYITLLLGYVYNDKFAICYAVISSQHTYSGIHMQCFIPNKLDVQNQFSLAF